jgi:hypothetical protein
MAVTDQQPSTLVARVLSERDWQQLADQRGRPCACDGHQRPCLAHYGLLDNPSRARVRRAVGIADFEGRRY